MDAGYANNRKGRKQPLSFLGVVEIEQWGYQWSYHLHQKKHGVKYSLPVPTLTVGQSL